MTNKGLRVGNGGFFGLLIFASALVHFLFILFVPTGHLLRRELFGGTNEPTTISMPLVFEFVEAGDEVKELAKKEELWKEELEEQKEQAEKEEEIKRQQFVDTADSAVDEEVEAKSDMIGEKGTLAQDTAPDEGPSTEEPRLDGDSEVPATGGLPGEGPGYSEGFAEMMTDILDIEETETNVSEEPGEADSVTEGEELVEAESKDATSETLQPDEGTMTEEVAMQETQTEEMPKEEVQGTEAPEEGTSIDRRLGQLEEELAKDAEGLLSVQERPKELAYIPPMEPQDRRQEAQKAQEQKKRTTKKSRKPKVAISFNAKTLSGGTIEPVYENKDANAPREGKGAFTVMKDEYAPYYRHIRDRITWYWVLKYGTKAEINLETEKNIPITIEFKVYPNGTIGAVKVVEEAGNHLLASYIRETIAETHLNKFPSYVEEEFIDVRFNFYFF